MKAFAICPLCKSEVYEGAIKCPKCGVVLELARQEIAFYKSRPRKKKERGTEYIHLPHGGRVKKTSLYFMKKRNEAWNPVVFGFFLFMLVVCVLSLIPR